MGLFKPELSLLRETNSTYTLYAVTLTPTSCYHAGRVWNGVPDGFAEIPEAIPFQLEILHAGELCLTVITPVMHQVHSITFGPGQDAVTAFTMLDGKVVGVNSIRRSAAIGAVGRPERLVARTTSMAAADEQPRCMSLGKAGVLVIASCPQPVASIDQQLKEVGVTDPDTQLLFVENVRQRVAQEGCHINQADIPNDPDDTVQEVRDAVFRAAR